MKIDEELEQLNYVLDRILNELADAEFELNEYEELVDRLNQQKLDTEEEIEEIKDRL